MATLSSHTMFVLVIALFYSLTPTRAGPIQDVCVRVSDHNFCLAILHSDPLASSASNLLDLGKAIIQMEDQNMGQTIDLIRGLRKNRGNPSPVTEGLAQCNNRCTLVQSDCFVATQHVDASRFGDASDDFVRMADNLNYCRLAMKDFPIDELSKENRKAFLISYLGAVVMSMLDKPSP